MNNTNKNYYNKTKLKETDEKNAQQSVKTERNYSYYSRVLEKPFDSLNELAIAEEAYYAKLKAKEDKAAQKKADAKVVEDAFIALNAARRSYKDELNAITSEYSENLRKLKESFEAAREETKAKLAKAEDTYSEAIKAFTDKYPEGYHITLKDGDFETTISGSSSVNNKTLNSLDLFNWIFNI